MIGIEGLGGISSALETALREAHVIFYSFKPVDIQRFRTAVLGQNKDDQRDAESVARYALALHSQGRLQRYRRVWLPDEDLQLLSRSYGRCVSSMTAETNHLWKLIRRASQDLYLALSGCHPDLQIDHNVLHTQGILNLLESQPDVGQWRRLSATQMLSAMGGGNYKGRKQLIAQLRLLSKQLSTISSSLALLVSTSARSLLRLKADQKQIQRMLGDITGDNPAVAALTAMPGIATVTASCLVAEIIDIRRFANDDRLASYCGLGMRLRQRPVISDGALQAVQSSPQERPADRRPLCGPARSRLAAGCLLPRSAGSQDVPA